MRLHKQENKYCKYWHSHKETSVQTSCQISSLSLIPGGNEESLHNINSPFEEFTAFKQNQKSSTRLIFCM